MISDAEIKTKGVKALVSALGPADTERFLTLLDRKPSDYSEWRDILFEDMSIDEINEEAAKLWEKRHDEGSIS